MKLPQYYMNKIPQHLLIAKNVQGHNLKLIFLHYYPIKNDRMQYGELTLHLAGRIFGKHHIYITV